MNFLKETPGAVVMDVGPTSPANVNFLTGIGCSIFLPDPLHDLATGEWTELAGDDEDGARSRAVERFVVESFSFAGREFDCVLLWDTLDYLPEPLLQPLVNQLAAVMKPGGKVLSFYHAKMDEQGVVHRRYHVTDSNQVESQAGAGYPQKRVLQNRNVERLFQSFGASRFLLAGDNLREAVFTR